MNSRAMIFFDQKLVVQDINLDDFKFYMVVDTCTFYGESCAVHVRNAGTFSKLALCLIS